MQTEGNGIATSGKSMPKGNVAKFSHQYQWADHTSSNLYKLREVGVTHPDTMSYIKISNNGDIELVYGEGCAIIVSSTQNRITIVCDEMKIFTNEEDGIVWNGLSFNPASISYHQPALRQTDTEENKRVYKSLEEHFG